MTLLQTSSEQNARVTCGFRTHMQIVKCDSILNISHGNLEETGFCSKIVTQLYPILKNIQ